MNLHPTEFDPSEELSRLGDPTQELFGLPQRVFFYLIETAHAIMAFAEPSFSIEPVLNNPKDNVVVGAAVKFIIRLNAFLIDTGPRVRLWASMADEPDSDDRYLVADGDASNPVAWQVLLYEIGAVEHFNIYIPHADKLRRMWSEWLVEQERRRKERGW